MSPARLTAAHGGATRREFLTGGLSLAALLTGCSSSATSQPKPSGGGSSFPLVVEHKFGRTEIPARPQRVVTAGFNGQDFALALGVTPVGVRDFIGAYQEQQRPWAQEELDGEQPTLVGGEELNFERIAALQPDLILAVYAFIDRKDYDLLAQIAPTVAQPSGFADGGVPWQKQTMITGRALGRKRRATRVVARVEQKFAEAVEQHPRFRGKTAAVAMSTSPDELFLLQPQDLRMRFFTALGFRSPKYTGKVSRERVELLDQDVLAFIGVDRKTLENDPLIQGLDAVREGRMIYFGDFTTDFAGALGFSSPLSLPFALDAAVPRLAAAVDGDPATRPNPAA